MPGPHAGSERMPLHQISLDCGLFLDPRGSADRPLTLSLSYTGEKEPIIARQAGTHASEPRSKPRNRGRALTLIGALGVEGIQATMTLEGGTDGVVFRTYVEQVLVPQLR